jgi:outer membrane protein TolC
MDRCSPRLRTFLRRLILRLGVAGVPLVALGCVEDSPVTAFLAPPAPVVRAAAPEALPEPKPQAPENSPPFLSSGHAGECAEGSHVVPISLDTLLRLAEDQNLQVAQARAKVDEAVAQQDLAKRWLPDLYVGMAYYRHEGGIQLENGDLIHSSTGAMLSGVDLHGCFDPHELAYQQVSAERRAWQQKGELSRITADTLLDAATTYIDLLAAQAALAINRDLKKDLEELLDRAEKLAKTEPGARVEAARARAELEGRRLAEHKLEAQRAAASAKLLYLLGMDPCTKLLPMDGDLVPIDLVDASRPTCDLIGQALAQGPGIRELEAIVGLVEDALHKAKGPARLLPTFEVRATEGAFGAGPGDDMKWDNRFDMALQMRWNLTQLATGCERGRIAEAQRAQVHLAYEDLRGKLTAGVQESQESILEGASEIRRGEDQIRHAREARRLSKQRLDEAIQGSSTSEVLLSLDSLGTAQLNYLTAIRDYDKAQIRLMVLLGPDAAHEHCGAPAPPPPGPLPTDVGTAK